jgi:hypothetical protein
MSSFRFKPSKSRFSASRGGVTLWGGLGGRSGWSHGSRSGRGGWIDTSSSWCRDLACRIVFSSVKSSGFQTYTYVCVCVCVCIYVYCTCMYIIYVCTCVCVCVCVCVCIHVYIYIMYSYIYEYDETYIAHIVVTLRLSTLVA